MHNAQQRTDPYPKHVSARADALIAELDEAQCHQLYAELKTIDVQEWTDWLGAARKEIARYDSLTPTERSARIRGPADTSALASPLRLHHAIVFLELWRARMQLKYLHLPPSGLPLDTPERHREMLLAAMASFHDYDLRDLWPFALPKGFDRIPFRR